MKPFDLSSLYRTGIGFDYLSELFYEAMRLDTQSGYPPYNVELIDENQYSITMALAGFDRSEIGIETENGTLKVVGRKQKDNSKHNYLHRGIAKSDFELRFQRADHVKAVGARMENGLLNIELVREIPEAMKPRKFEISGGNAQWVNEQKEPERLESSQGQEPVGSVKEKEKQPVAA